MRKGYASLSSSKLLSSSISSSSSSSGASSWIRSSALSSMMLHRLANSMPRSYNASASSSDKLPASSFSMVASSSLYSSSKDGSFSRLGIGYLFDARGKFAFAHANFERVGGGNLRGVGDYLFILADNGIAAFKRRKGIQGIQLTLRTRQLCALQGNPASQGIAGFAHQVIQVLPPIFNLGAGRETLQGAHIADITMPRLTQVFADTAMQ